MRIVALRPDDGALVRQVARLLVEGFREQEPEAFPDMRSALAEVRKSFGPDRPSRVAVDPPGTALGWIGGFRLYRGRTWELHPLVVRPARQRQGIGRALVRNFERQIARRRATTVFLGTDDVDGRTSVAGVELYPDVLAKARRIRNCAAIPMSSTRSSGTPSLAPRQTPTGAVGWTSSWPSG